MSEFIRKKRAAAKNFKIFLLVLLLVTLGAIVVLSAFTEAEKAMPVLILLPNLLWICGVVYLAKYTPFMSSIKRLEKKGLLHVADDINPDTPTLPLSKIHCGQQALYSKKPCLILAYSEIAWVHLFEQRMYGITVERAVIVHTNDGKKYSLKANEEEFKWLLGNCVLPVCPQVLLGYGPEQQMKYKLLVKEYKRTH